MAAVQLRNESGKIYTGWLIMIMGIFLMTFGYSCVVSVSGAFVLPVTESLGIQIGSFSAYITIMSVTSILFLTIVSRFYSQKTIRPIMFISCICGIIGFIGFATSHSLTQFYIFSVALGICFGGLTTTPCSLLITNWFGPKLRGLALGILFGGNSIAVMLVLPALNYIIQHFGWRVAYFSIAGALLVICIPLIAKFATWSPAQLGLRRIGDETDSSGNVAEMEGMDFQAGLKKPSTWIMFLSGTLLVIASSSILTHSQPFMVMNGYSPTFAANVVSVMIGITLPTGILIGALCDRCKLQIPVMVSGLFFVGAFVAQIFIPQWGIAMILLFIVGYGIGCPSVNIITPLLVNHMFGEKNAAAFIGYANVFIGIGGAIGSTVVGKLYDFTGSYIAPFWLCAALLLAMVIIRAIVTLPKFKFKKS